LFINLVSSQKWCINLPFRWDRPIFHLQQFNQNIRIPYSF
jgi:hypothetical protein